MRPLCSAGLVGPTVNVGIPMMSMAEIDIIGLQPRAVGGFSCDGRILALNYRVKTVLPCVLPSHIARKASSARSMGRTFPISGAMPAPAMKDIMFFMS